MGQTATQKTWVVVAGHCVQVILILQLLSPQNIHKPQLMYNIVAGFETKLLNCLLEGSDPECSHPDLSNY